MRVISTASSGACGANFSARVSDNHATGGLPRDIRSSHEIAYRTPQGTHSCRKMVSIGRQRTLIGQMSEGDATE
jgi:hypothetical protein